MTLFFIFLTILFFGYYIIEKLYSRQLETERDNLMKKITEYAEHDIKVHEEALSLVGHSLHEISQFMNQIRIAAQRGREENPPGDEWKSTNQKTIQEEEKLPTWVEDFIKKNGREEIPLLPDEEKDFFGNS